MKLHTSMLAIGDIFCKHLGLALCMLIFKKKSSYMEISGKKFQTFHCIVMLLQ